MACSDVESKMYYSNSLWYIQFYHDSFDDDQVVKAICQIYKQYELIDAKKQLLQFCQTDLISINKPLYDEVKKARKSTRNRTKE